MMAETCLLQVDYSGTVTYAHTNSGDVGLAYSVYGLDAASLIRAPYLRFNGQCLELAFGYYLLGKGYRGYHPVLMRFNSPDSYCPFGPGGLNAYTYCAGDPVNRSDPSGHVGRTKSAVNKLFRQKADNGKPTLSGFRRLLEEGERRPAFSAGVLAIPSAPVMDDSSWRGSQTLIASDYTPSAPPVAEFVRRGSSASQESEHVPSAPPVSEFVRRASLVSIISNYLPSAPMSEGPPDQVREAPVAVHPHASTRTALISIAGLGQQVREAD